MIKFIPFLFILFLQSDFGCFRSKITVPIVFQQNLNIVVPAGSNTVDLTDVINLSSNSSYASAVNRYRSYKIESIQVQSTIFSGQSSSIDFDGMMSVGQNITTPFKVKFPTDGLVKLNFTETQLNDLTIFARENPKFPLMFNGTLSSNTGASITFRVLVNINFYL